MTVKTIIDTLEHARLAASPSDAIILADAIADLDALADALARNGWTLSDAPAAPDDLKALREHVRAQPFESCGEADGTTTVEGLTPGAFAEWLATLERLAQ